jgi:LPS-assembly protein
MTNSIKGKAKYFFYWWCLPLLILLTYHLNSFGGKTSIKAAYKFEQIVVDTPPVIKKDTTKLSLPPTRDSFKLPSIAPEKTKVIDTTKNNILVDTFNYKKSKDALTQPVVYHADDSMVIDVPAEKMYLYGKVSSIKYEDNNLSAPKIEFDNKTSIVSAFLVKDSTGKAISYPYFNQNDVQTVSDTIKVNMKNGKGLTKGTYTKQGEMFVYGDKIKKIDTSVFYAYRTRFTTCNLDTPHFAFIAKKAKFINKKWAFTGPVHPEFEGVPLPISLPFGIFPLTQGRHSGLLAPSFNADAQRGLGLENLGYYKVFGDKWDLVTRGSIYSYGSWNLNFNPRYYKRYHYQGNFVLSIQNTKILDEPKTNTFNITWNHSVDSKARPGVTFSANVNAGSNKFNQFLPGSPRTNFNNSLNSSISYAKVWKNRPYNISVNANHNQNSVSKETIFNLPDIAFNVNTLYPFRKKEPIGESKWYENLGIGYQGSTRTTSSFNDTLGNIGSQLSKNLKYGAQHQIPISLSLPPLGVVQLAPSVSFNASFYQQRIRKSFNPNTNKIDTLSLQKGLFAAGQVSFGMAATTRIFGMYGFNKNSRIKAIRHEIRPNISLNYTPNINEWNYYNSQVSATQVQKISSFEGNTYSAYGNQRSGGIAFSLDNIVSMKIKDKSDTSATADKKVTLIDGLSINTFYNFLADSFKLQPISVSARTNLFQKVTLSADASFDPYQVNEFGRPIDKYIIGNKFALGRLTTASVALQTSFKGGEKSKNSNTQNNLPQNTLQNEGITDEEFQREATYIRNNPAEFADFEIPWNIDFSYSLRVSKDFDPLIQSFRSTLSQSATFNASVNLTPKWKIGTNGTFDITNKTLGVLSMYLTRDLHCWQMAINISPVGRSRFFSINISPKSPILRDLKVNRTRTFTDF